MQSKSIKLSPKKDGYGNISSFTINISVKEALSLGLINEDKSINTIVKIVDTANNQLIIKKDTL